AGAGAGKRSRGSRRDFHIDDGPEDAAYTITSKSRRGRDDLLTRVKLRRVPMTRGTAILAGCFRHEPSESARTRMDENDLERVWELMESVWLCMLSTWDGSE